MDIYLDLARKTIQHYFKTEKLLPIPDNLSEELTTRRAGVFVSFKADNELRGCIGTYKSTTESLAQEIINNTIAAAISDPRFSPIQEQELKNIKISIDILSNPVKIKDDLKNQLNTQKYGVIVKSEDEKKVGLLLPDLEGVNSIDQQLSIACQKAGIDYKSEKYKIYKFTVDRHEE